MFFLDSVELAPPSEKTGLPNWGLALLFLLTNARTLFKTNLEAVAAFVGTMNRERKRLVTSMETFAQLTALHPEQGPEAGA